MSEEVKSPLKSKTVIGGLIAILPFLSDLAEQLAGMPILPPQFAATIAAVGGSIAIVGRFLAKLPLKF